MSPIEIPTTMEQKPTPAPAPGSPRESGLSGAANWISLAGAVLAVCAFFAFILLLSLELFSHQAHPYLGILTFMVAPAFLILGLAMLGGGWLHYHLRKVRHTETVSPLRFAIDLTRAKDRKRFLVFVGLVFTFLFISAFGSYRTYHVTESVAFCGEVCHTVMEPEYTTYLGSPHARVSCVECHIGSGAKWYVKSKISGLYQVYATVFNKYPRPIATPIENLRPAQDTCEQCHWPQKFTGDMVRSYEHTLSDDENSEFNITLLLKVGGGNPSRGPVGGIHWHTDPSNRIEFFAADEKRMEIPWVRMTAADGTVTVFRRDGYDGTPDPAHIRVMDCMDCHNRPAHILRSPNDALDRAFADGRLDRSLTALKACAVELLEADYETVEQACAAIESGLVERYEDEGRDDPRVMQAIVTVQTIYRENFFPLMKADWTVYPEHIGHKNWPGCFRCHDGEHVAETTNHVLQANDCNSCHAILAQGVGEELLQMAPAGLEFAHPDGDVSGFLCSDCHTGGMQ